MHAGAILQALAASEDEPPHTQELADLFIEAALAFEGQPDERMSGILAELITGCEGGDHDLAGHRINAYQGNHKLKPSALQHLRMVLGGTPALGGIMDVLTKSLDRYFQQPIYNLNEDTRTGWREALENASRGFATRLWMSVAVFALGAIVVLGATFKLFFQVDASTSPVTLAAALTTFGAGLGTMLLIIYVGPLKEIRQAVVDLASANAAFMAYVHRILETSHTFSYYYLKEQISFEKLQQSSQIIREAMDDTIGVLNTKAIDSAERIIRRAVTAAFEHEGRSAPGSAAEPMSTTH